MFLIVFFKLHRSLNQFFIYINQNKLKLVFDIKYIVINYLNFNIKL